MIMLHCYWQYTEETKDLLQTPLLKNKTLLPVKPIEVTETGATIDPIAPMPEQISETPNNIVETTELTEMTETTKKLIEPIATITEPSTAPERSGETEPSAVTDLIVPTSKPMLQSTELSAGELNSNLATLEPIEVTEHDNSIELGDALTDSITPIHAPDLAVLDSVVETQTPIIAETEHSPILEQVENATEENMTIPEPN